MSSRIESIDTFEVWYKYEVLGWSQREISDYYSVSQPTIFYRLHPEKQKEKMSMYNQSDAGKERAKRYSQTGKGKAAVKRYAQSEKGIYRSKRFWQSDKGKILAKRKSSIRRELGFIPLNEPFENSHAHHIDDTYIIHIPKELHKSIYHNVFTCEGMEEINTIAFGYITEEVFDKLIAGEI